MVPNMYEDSSNYCNFPHNSEKVDVKSGLTNSCNNQYLLHPEMENSPLSPESGRNGNSNGNGNGSGNANGSGNGNTANQFLSPGQQLIYRSTGTQASLRNGSNSTLPSQHHHLTHNNPTSNSIVSGTPGLSGAVTAPQPTQPPQLPQPPCTPPRKHKAGHAQERCSSSAHRTHTRTKDIGTETETNPTSTKETSFGAYSDAPFPNHNRNAPTVSFYKNKEHGCRHQRYDDTLKRKRKQSSMVVGKQYSTWHDKYGYVDRFFLICSPFLFLVFNIIYWGYFYFWNLIFSKRDETWSITQDVDL